MPSPDIDLVVELRRLADAEPVTVDGVFITFLPIQPEDLRRYLLDAAASLETQRETIIGLLGELARRKIVASDSDAVVAELQRQAGELTKDGVVDWLAIEPSSLLAALLAAIETISVQQRRLADVRLNILDARRNVRQAAGALNAALYGVLDLPAQAPDQG